MRRVKIVATIGPATASLGMVHALVEEGVDVVRLNMSHGEQPGHHEVLRHVRAAAAASGRAVGVLADLQGPKIRLGRFRGDAAHLHTGAAFIITTDDVDGDEDRASTTYPGLPGDVDTGDAILVDDGRVVLEVRKVDGRDVHTIVVEGGRVGNSKGLNLPGAHVNVPALSDKDVDDLRWALRNQVDLVALSFVRAAADADAVRAVMADEGVRLPVIAKIEKPQAVEALEDILDSFDAIMVARGDLGVEMPLQQVPLVQKRAVMRAREKGKPVIVATQMLESMIGSPRPTRAEASDVANAVLDGADALMLSGETGIGRFPIEAVETMGRVIGAVEDGALDRLPPLQGKPTTKGGAIARAAVEVADLTDAKFLVAFTETGRTARILSRYRSPVPLLAYTPVERVRSFLALVWGVETFLVDAVTHTDEMVRQVDRLLLESGRCRVGDNVVIVAGSPPGIPGSTNAMRVHRIGDAAGGVARAYQDA